MRYIYIYILSGKIHPRPQLGLSFSCRQNCLLDIVEARENKVQMTLAPDGIYILIPTNSKLAEY